MRNQRISALAVLTVALVAATSAIADVNVTTVIVDPNGEAGTWLVRNRIWGEGGIGDTDYFSAGMWDFIVPDIAGVGPVQVTGATNIAPVSWYTLDGNRVDVGFWDLLDDGEIVPPAGATGIMGLQNAGYAESGNDPVMDGAVLQNIGQQAGSWTVPNADPNGGDISWDADVQLASGTYDANGAADPMLAAHSNGLVSQSVLPDPDGNGVWEGPTNNLGDTSWVTGAVVVIQKGDAGYYGNDGGADGFDRETTMVVADGTFTLNPAEDVGANVSLVIGDALAGSDSANDKAVIAGDDDFATVDQTVESVTINTGVDGNQMLDLNRSAIDIVPGDGDVAGTEAGVLASIIHNEDVNGDEGIGDGTDQGAGEMVGWVADADSVKVQLTIEGDTDLSGVVDFVDYTAVLVNYLQPTSSWYEGDVDRSGVVDFVDYTAVLVNYLQAFQQTPPPAAPRGGVVPEPMTLALLGFGGLAVLGRRRKKV